MTQGSDVLDALIEGVNIVELDPEDYSVGYGGVPNAEGVVQLDSSCMHGPLKRAGGVAALEGVQDAVARRPRGDEQDRPSPPRRQGRAELRAQHGLRDRGRPEHAAVAQAVARVEAAHRPVALPDARRSARSRTARRAARRWRGRAGSRAPRCTARSTATASTRRARSAASRRRRASSSRFPGRVGDSPILGAGLYVDGAVGAAGSTGRGEANLYNLSSLPTSWTACGGACTRRTRGWRR